MVVVLACGCTDTTKLTELDVPFVPLLLMYRIDSGGWQTPSGTRQTDGSMKYELRIDGEFELVIACAQPMTNSGYGSGFMTQEFFGTQDEFGVVAVYPCKPSSIPPAPSIAMVSGTTAQAGWVSMSGSSQYSTSAPWSYQLTVPTGTADLVASTSFTSPPSCAATDIHIAVRHGQSIATNFAEPEIDLCNEGIGLDNWDLSILGGAPSSEQLLMMTKNGTLASVSPYPSIVPASQLEDGDFQYLLVSDDTLAPTSRSISIYFTETPPPVNSFTLLPPSSPAYFETTSTEVQWTSLPEDYTFVNLGFGDADNNNQDSVTAGSAWLTGHTTGRLSFDTQVPGIESAWAPSGSLWAVLQVFLEQSFSATDSVEYQTYLGLTDTTSRMPPSHTRPNAMTRGPWRHP
jgi:hypothetical protein